MKLKYNLEHEQRLDKFLVENLEDFTRNQIIHLIKGAFIEINEETIQKPAYKIKGKGIIKIDISSTQSIDLIPWDNWNALEVIFENNDYLVINKPANLSVHPGAGNQNNTLVNILISKNYNLPNNSTLRPGIVHRLDKNTTGVIVVAKTEEFYLHLQKQFLNRSVRKKYFGLVQGNFKNLRGEIDLPISRNPNDRKKFSVISSGKVSITQFKVQERYKNFDLVEFNLITGRTHQIRVHCKFLGNPIYNDAIYSKRVEKDNGHYLHAYEITFLNMKNELVSYKAKLPEYFQEKINNLERER